MVVPFSNIPRRLLASTTSIHLHRKKNLVYALVAGTGLGTGYAVYQSRPVPMPDLNDVSFSSAVMRRPLSTYSKQVRMNDDKIDGDRLGKFTLYQFFSCPFCCKVRAYLDYYGIDYDIVEVNSVTKKQLKWSDYKKVPILVSEDGNAQINDSNVIISVLESKRNNPNMEIANILPLYGPEVKQNKRKLIYTYSNVYTIPGMTMSDEEKQWREWVDKKLIPVAGLSIYRTLGESVRSFKWFSKAGDWSQSFGVIMDKFTVYSGALIMYIVSKMRQMRKGDVVTLEELIGEFSRELSSKTFLGGKNPNLADVSAYGALMALSGCDRFASILNDENVARWWKDMQKLVSEHNGALSEKQPVIPAAVVQNSMLYVLIAFAIAKFIEIGLVSDKVI